MKSSHKIINLNKFLDSISRVDRLIPYLDANIYSNFVEENTDFIEKCFRKFSNLYFVSPDWLRENETYTNIAIKVTASNVLFLKDLDFEKLKGYVKLNPFVCVYAIEFVSEKEQDLLFFEAFKNTEKLCFLNDIKDETLKENILLNIHFKNLKISDREVKKEVKKYISTFNKEELEELKDLWKDNKSFF